MYGESCSVKWRPYCSCRWGKVADASFGKSEGSTMDEQNAEDAAGQSDRISQHDAAQAGGAAQEPDVQAPEAPTDPAAAPAEAPAEAEPAADESKDDEG